MNEENYVEKNYAVDQFTNEFIEGILTDHFESFTYEEIIEMDDPEIKGQPKEKDMFLSLLFIENPELFKDLSDLVDIIILHSQFGEHEEKIDSFFEKLRNTPFKIDNNIRISFLDIIRFQDELNKITAKSNIINNYNYVIHVFDIMDNSAVEKINKIVDELYTLQLSLNSLVSNFPYSFEINEGIYENLHSNDIHTFLKDIDIVINRTIRAGIPSKYVASLVIDLFAHAGYYIIPENEIIWGQSRLVIPECKELYGFVIKIALNQLGLIANQFESTLSNWMSYDEYNDHYAYTRSFTVTYGSIIQNKVNTNAFKSFKGIIKREMIAKYEDEVDKIFKKNKIPFNPKSYLNDENFGYYNGKVVSFDYGPLTKRFIDIEEEDKQ